VSAFKVGVSVLLTKAEKGERVNARVVVGVFRDHHKKRMRIIRRPKDEEKGGQGKRRFLTNWRDDGFSGNPNDNEV